MRVLVACEESQQIASAFRAKGYEAYSCDLQPCGGDFPELHIQGDALVEAYSGKYDLMIAHPPCTFMSNAGARWMYPKSGELCQERLAKAMDAKAFFMKLWNAPCPFIALENPTPLRIVDLPEPSQVIQPYQFGDPYSKRTLLWLKNLPPLQHTDVLSTYIPYLPSGTSRKASKGILTVHGPNQKQRSRTFPGIAAAIADQWGTYVQDEFCAKSQEFTFIHFD